MNVNAHIHIGMQGRFKLAVRKADTLEQVSETHWMDNLILNQGLNRKGTNSVSGVCEVGTSSTPPNIAQTGLISKVAHTSTIVASSGSAQGSAPYFGRATQTYRFAAGVATGTLAEVGVGWDITNDLWCRALIVDMAGNPTTITVLADEVLDVTYELRLYPDLVDKVFIANIGGIDRDCILRASEVTEGTVWGVSIFGAAGFTSFVGNKVFNGALGGITVNPSGTSDFISSFNQIPYVNNSLELKIVYVWDLNAGNLVGGITAALFETTIGAYKISFSPAIAKTNADKLTLQMLFTWGRYVP